MIGPDEKLVYLNIALDATVVRHIY